MLRALDREIRAVTFDCWGTLLCYEIESSSSRRRREQALARAAARAGLELEGERAAELLTRAHSMHTAAWEAERSTGSPEMARWTLEPLGIRDPEITAELVRAFEDASLPEQIDPLEGATHTLEALTRLGVRLALVCDTGFSPGRVVRQILHRVGLLPLLEVAIFSDEAGAPKPNPMPFRAALEGLGVPPLHAIHVGDLLRTDIAGARAIGMGTVRIRAMTDDPAALPEADAVADSHGHLRELLGLD